MIHQPYRLFFSLNLVLGLVCLSFAQEKKEQSKPADWSKFADAGKMIGEVWKIEKDGVSVKSTVVPGVGIKKKAEEVQLKFADGGMLRWKVLPPKSVDDKGKKTLYTPKEQQEKKTPPGVPGYMAEMDELKVGHILEITLVRPKEIPVNKAVLQDFTMKYAIIVGENPSVGKK